MLKVNFIVIKNSSKQWKKENNKTKVHKSSGLSMRYFQRELKV